VRIGELLLWFANRDGIIPAFPALILLPEKCKLNHRTARAVLRWKISEPQIQCAIIGGFHTVGAHPIIS
jgi:hypothetical protein